MARVSSKGLSFRSAGQRHEELFVFAVCAFAKLCRRIHVDGMLVNNTGRVVDLFLGSYQGADRHEA